MKDKVMDFEDSFVLTGARFLTSENRCCFTSYGFRIVKGQKESYLSAGSSHSNKYKDFMLKITDVRTPNGPKDVLEQDIVDYRLKNDNKRSVGVIIYDKDNYCFAIKDSFSRTVYPLSSCKLFDVLGNIYEHPTFLNTGLEAIYKKLGRLMPREEEYKEEESMPKYAALSDIEMPGIPPDRPIAKKEPEAQIKEEKITLAPDETKKEKTSLSNDKNKGVIDIFFSVKPKSNALPEWEYMLKSGANSKEDKGTFKQDGNYAYYEVAALAIAVSNIHHAKKVRIHSASDVIPKLLSNGLLNKFAENDWMTENGKPLKNTTALKSLKKQLDRLGANYEVLLLESKTLAAGVA